MNEMATSYLEIFSVFYCRTARKVLLSYFGFNLPSRVLHRVRHVIFLLFHFFLLQTEVVNNFTVDFISWGKQV